MSKCFDHLCEGLHSENPKFGLRHKVDQICVHVPVAHMNSLSLASANI